MSRKPKEYIRRKSTGPKPASGPYDLVDDWGAERLQTFAAIILTWNYIETFIDAILGVALRIDSDFFTEVSSRINGLDGKIGIIKRCLDAPENIRIPISKTLNAVESYKIYRDAIAHIKIVDPKSPLAHTAPKRGELYEVLVTQEALDAVHERIAILGTEVSQVFQVLAKVNIAAFSRKNSTKSKRALEQGRLALARLREAQSQREALPPLPEFPDQLQAQLDSEASPMPPG